MAETSDWPSYPAVPRDSTFAIGVVSIEYARLEYIMSNIFSELPNIRRDIGAALLERLNNKSRIAMMRLALPKRGWPEHVVDLVSYFLDSFDMLSENRNLLMHSNLIAGVAEETALFKPRRSDGQMTLCRITLPELRKVADDMNAYSNFGFQLAAMIRPQAGDIAYRAWPDKPSLPSPLEYSGPQHPKTLLRDL